MKAGTFSGHTHAKQGECRCSDVVQLQAHAVVNFVVLQSDVVLENAVPARQVNKRESWKEQSTRESSANTSTTRRQSSSNVPLLKPDFFGARACLRRNELLQIADGVIGIALDSNFLAQTVVAHNLDHALEERERDTNDLRSHNTQHISKIMRGSSCQPSQRAPTPPSTTRMLLLPATRQRLKQKPNV